MKDKKTSLCGMCGQSLAPDHSCGNYAVEAKKTSWEKEFNEKWERMRKGGFGKIASIDGRMIWSVDEDEDSYVFADETIKAFIRQVIKEERQQAIRETIEPFANVMSDYQAFKIDETDLEVGICNIIASLKAKEGVE